MINRSRVTRIAKAEDSILIEKIERQARNDSEIKKTKTKVNTYQSFAVPVPPAVAKTST